MLYILKIEILSLWINFDARSSMVMPQVPDVEMEIRFDKTKSKNIFELQYRLQ